MNKGVMHAMLRVFLIVVTAGFGLVSTAARAGDMRRVVSDYAITPASGLGIVRAFYYGPNSVIEFENPPSSFSAVDGDGKKLEFEPEGRFIRLIGRPSVFVATFSGKAASFRSYTDATKIPKPTVDELAKFDNFYDQKQKTSTPQAYLNGQHMMPSRSENAATSTLPAVAEQPARTASAEVKHPGALVTTSAQIIGTQKAATPIKQWRVLLIDQTLQGTLRRWAASAGWQLSWEVPQDVPVTLTAEFEGTFEQAIGGVFDSLAGSDSPVKGCMYENNVLRVVSRAVRCSTRSE